MADYSRFDLAIVPWLQQVWRERQTIKFWAETSGRKLAADEVYALYTGPDPDRKMNANDAAFTSFKADLDSLVSTYKIPYICDDLDNPKAFFHFLNPKGGAGSWRVYANGKVARHLVSIYCLRKMASAKDIVEFKIAGPGASRRRDQVVIYVLDDKARDVVLHDLQGHANRELAMRDPQGETFRSKWFVGDTPPA